MTEANQTVTKDTVVLMHYTLHNASGELLEDISNEDPVALLHGRGNVIRGLEQALAGRQAGEEFDVVIQPEDGYGERKDDQIQRVSKKYFAQPKRLKPGMRTQLRTENGSRTVTVVKIGGKVIDVDTNHPLAGETLHFHVSITEVRPATPSELAHGHAHADGQDHH